MSSKRVINNKNYLVDGDMSADILGDAVKIEGIDRISFQASFGTAIGTLHIEVSNNGDTWADSGATPSQEPLGGAGTAIIEVETACAFARFVFVFTSGTGALQAHVVAKGWS